MVDPKELDIEIARLEYAESSYESYAKLAMLYVIRITTAKRMKNRGKKKSKPLQTPPRSHLMILAISCV